MMKFLLRAIVTGFGLSLGAALFKKVSKYVGLEEDAKVKESNPAENPVGDGGSSDSELQHQYS